MRRLALVLVALLAAGGARPALAERLVVSLSNHRVAVTSNFVGENLVLFGTIEPDVGKTALRPSYDLVVTVTGPRQTLRTRRKERVLGIWVNVDSREFVRVPAYLAVLSNRPVGEIARPDVLRKLQIGLDNFLLPQRIGPGTPPLSQLCAPPRSACVHHPVSVAPARAAGAEFKAGRRPARHQRGSPPRAGGRRFFTAPAQRCDSGAVVEYGGPWYNRRWILGLGLPRTEGAACPRTTVT